MTNTADKLEVGSWFVGSVERADLLGSSSREFPGEKVRVHLVAPGNELAIFTAKFLQALPVDHPCQLTSGHLWVIGSRPTRSRRVPLTWWAEPAHPTRAALVELAKEITGTK